MVPNSFLKLKLYKCYLLTSSTANYRQIKKPNGFVWLFATCLVFNITLLTKKDLEKIQVLSLKSSGALLLAHCVPLKAYRVRLKLLVSLDLGERTHLDKLSNHQFDFATSIHQ